MVEKQDFIIENQKKRIAEKQAVLDEITMRVLDMENFVEQVAEDAYEKACEAVSDTMAEQTRAEDIEELRRYKKWLTSDERHQRTSGILSEGVLIIWKTGSGAWHRK